ncbi:MAG: recombination-associated protein RdgC [Succinivibrionaceae bacterium]|nr:recombination-associated protein RdgC [Succinivibrionaceae bacterium]
MWFKNLRVYHLKENLSISQETLETQLKSFAFAPCTSDQTETQGLVPPLGDKTDSLYHVSDGQYLFAARFEKKLLPASVVKDMVNEKVEEFESEKGRKPKGKEKSEIKDAVMLYLLPKAFAVHSDIYAIIDPKNALVYVDTASAAKAEAVLSLVRKALGTLPVEPLKVNESASSAMTGWLLENRLPSRFQTGDQISMYSTRNEKKVVNAKTDDLMEDEILNHLKQDKIVSKIALVFDETLSFVLDEELNIKRLKFTEEFFEREEETENEDALARLAADIFAQLAVFSRLTPYIIREFGGLAQS